MKKFEEFLAGLDLEKIEKVCDEIKYKALVGPVHRAHEGAYEGIRDELEKSQSMAFDYGTAASVLLTHENDQTILYLAFPISHGNLEMASAAAYSRLLKGKKAFIDISGSLDDIEFTFVSKALIHATTEDFELLVTKFLEDNWYSQLLNLYLTRPDRRLLDALDLIIASKEEISLSRMRLLTTIIRINYPDLITAVAARIAPMDPKYHADFVKDISAGCDDATIEMVLLTINGPECVLAGKSFKRFLENADSALQHSNIENYPFHFYGIENHNSEQLKKTVAVFSKHVTKVNLDDSVRYTRANIGTSIFIRSEFQRVISELIETSFDCEILTWASTLSYFWTNDLIAEKAIKRMLKSEALPDCYNMPDNFRKRLAATGLKSSDLVLREMLIEKLLVDLDYENVLRYLMRSHDSRLLATYEAATKIHRVSGLLSQELATEFSRSDKDVIIHVTALAKKYFYKTDFEKFIQIIKDVRPELTADLNY